jgi:hypothetical protein
VSQFLDFAELQAVEERAMTMEDWISELDRHVKNNYRELLTGKGNISNEQAKEKANKEFKIYRDKEMKQLNSDFDKTVKKIISKNKKIEDD